MSLRLIESLYAEVANLSEDCSGERTREEAERPSSYSIASPRLYAFAGPSRAPIPSAQTVAQLPTLRSVSWSGELVRARASRVRRERTESMTVREEEHK